MDVVDWVSVLTMIAMAICHWMTTMSVWVTLVTTVVAIWLLESAIDRWWYHLVILLHVMGDV